MNKYQNNIIRVITILFMLSTAPLAVTYSYAESEENLDLEGPKKEPKPRDKSQKEGPQAILTEKMVNGKLEVKQFALPENTTKDDMNRILSLEGASGWSYVNSNGYHSGIVLFDGKASKVGEKYWTISVNGKLNLSKGELDLEIIGKSNNSNQEMTENTFNKDLDYKVIFSGKMIESDEGDEFVIAFINSTLKNSEKSSDIKFPQFENLSSESMNSMENNQKVRIPVLVI